MSKTLQYFLLVLLIGGLTSCSSSREVVTEAPVSEPPTTQPVEEVSTSGDEAPVETEGPSEEVLLHRWMHLDGVGGQYNGVATDRVYETYLADKQPQQTVIVAVIDSGIDIEHEDLSAVIWVNEDELPGNAMDDDKNGYVDDRNGWNFIGGPGGEQIDYDTFEVTREYVRLSAIYEDVDPNSVSEDQQEEYSYYLEVVDAFESERAEMTEIKANYDQAVAILNSAHSIIANHLGTEDYSIEDVRSITTGREDLQQAQSVLVYFDSIDVTRDQLIDEYEQINGYLEKGLNPNFEPRGLVGDNYDDPTEQYYGNNSVEGPDARHGTHVAGIIAAVRGNGIGMDGVANSVRIMPVRAVPNGDERDKDIANAIRYAVDNGARVINMSFGKDFSPYKEVVDEAVLYAEEKGVLMVHAAGNDALDNDETLHFPVPEIDAQGRKVANWIEVGASNWEGMDNLAAVFSNYGQESVDLFAPGVDIYSTTPDNTYESLGGTSMAAPVVSGIAALIMAYYPEFTAEEVKRILIDSAVPYRGKLVVLPGSDGEQVDFGTLSQSGAIVNAYRAFALAEERASE